ncbi:MAG TPA: enoyl-CoA hydratase/isomerase family protein [Gammaproteobacteria bacterium]|nr:enoyl-CoA hydratase/isomerase family protein [Gammaproteobacteria bacterium]
MSDALVLTEQCGGGIVRVVLNRPQVLNAVDAALRDALIRTLHALQADSGTRAVVLTGVGDRAFCAGQDLEEAAAFEIDDVDAWLTHQRAMLQALREFTKPAVAALNGVAAGAGFQIGLLCDLRVGYAELGIGQTEIRAGLASVIGSYLMTLHLGLSKNLELSLTGNLISGTQAQALGLINHLVPRAEVFTRALAAATELAARSPTAVRLTKERFRELTQAGFDAAIAAAIDAGRIAYASGEPQAQMREFLARRTAKRDSPLE